MALILVVGGVRSGKSGFAERLAIAEEQRMIAAAGQDDAVSPGVVYVATLAPGDGEMAERIERHRLRRPPRWQLLEAPDRLPDMRELEGCHVLLVDGLSGWVGNRLLKLGEQGQARAAAPLAAILAELEGWLQAVKASGKYAVIVTDEAGWGGVAMTPLGRSFQDLLGEANQLAAVFADEGYAIIAGMPLRIKG